MATDPARRRELRVSLEERLERACPHAITPVTARIRWLGEQLENYVERWLGFAVLPGATIPSLLEGDLFAIVDISAGVLDNEIRLLPESAGMRKSWTRLGQILLALRQPDALLNVDGTRAALRAFVDSTNAP